jgi:hypothetical protein
MCTVRKAIPTLPLAFSKSELGTASVLDFVNKGQIVMTNWRQSSHVVLGTFFRVYGEIEIPLIDCFCGFMDPAVTGLLINIAYGKYHIY